MPIESIKQSVIKVYGEESQTRTISLNNIVDAESILKRILQKFNINEDVENYSLFATMSDTGEIEICKNSDRPERERLTLRKKHLPMSFEQSKKQKKDLERFFGEKPPSNPQVGISQKKLKNFFGQRPPSELIQLNLTEYFPGHNSEELERSVARSSIYRRVSRVSAASRFSVQRSNDDRSNTATASNYNSDRSSTILAPSVNSSTAIQEEQEEEVDFHDFDYEDEEYVMSDPEDGMGSFGSVYLGLNAFTGEFMAVKQVELPTANSSNNERKKSMLDALQREIALLEELHHENIVQYLGKSSQLDEGTGTFNIFLEYVPGGSVASMLNLFGPLEENLIRSYVRQILQGLNYLHEKDIIHRDIKGANILVDNKGIIKISDFGKLRLYHVIYGQKKLLYE
ncbi:423_t:CDS:2 [Racocetra fulgida]|uniref:423_t:CDS:1 n=1 Tax=Racocetra fulgida TaxID=60492 RepID=A0A9N8WCC1_9GLOM|nr:423_t:CDS:2 [Racocetra fulgida]